MTPDEMAALHATVFDGAARWSADSFRQILSDPTTFLVVRPDGFLLGRVIADEAELLSLVVAAAAQRRGLGRDLLMAFETKATEQRATEAFLEVAADNASARALYDSAGWQQAGRRRGYYQGIDALILRKTL